MAEYMAFLRHDLQWMDVRLRFYGARRWRRLRWKTHIAKEKCWGEIVRRITGNQRDTIVALGSAIFPHNSRGHASSPTKSLYRRLLGKCTVRLIDEFRTSITCSHCYRGLPQRTRLWQVKACQGCLICWNRDVNAARNMLRIFLHMNANNGQRPLPFRRRQT
jgi:transposase